MSESSENGAPLYSIVIPVYNEATLISELHARVSRAVQQLGASYEIVYVNDGSRDDSFSRLRSLCLADSRVKAVNLSRNFGQQAAISAGLWYARGERVVVMDGDLQDPPELIHAMVAKYEEGFDVVYGVRMRRKETWWKRAAYHTFYRLMRRVARIEVPLDAGDFSLLSRRVVDLINQMPETNRFVRGLRSWVGLRQAGLPYERDARFAGEAKYTLGQLLQLSLDGLFSFSYVPLRLALYVGIVVSLVSFMGILAVLWWRFTTGTMGFGFASLAIVILFLGGLQLMTIGVVGEYLGRVFDEVKLRPKWIVGELVGFQASSFTARPVDSPHATMRT